MRRALEDQFACMEETWDNLLQCVRLYAIHIDNDAVFGELVGVMKSTKKVIDTALLASEQFTRASPVCTDVDKFLVWMLARARMQMIEKTSLKKKTLMRTLMKTLKRKSLKRTSVGAALVKMSVRTSVKALKTMS